MRMTHIGRRRLMNKYFVLSAIFLFLLLVISFLINGEIIKVLLSDSYENFAAKKIVIDDELCWESLLFNGIYYLLNVLPFFAIIVTLPFSEEKNTFYVYATNRLKSRRKSICKAILSYGVMGGLAVSAGFFLYFCAGAYFCIPTLDYISGFESIFNYQLYNAHPFLFLCFMDFTIYFLLGFLFAVMSCGVMLAFDNKITSVILPMFIYIVTSYLGNELNIHILQSSSCSTAFCTDYTTGQCFIPLIPIAVIDVILIMIGIRKNEEVII